MPLLFLPLEAPDISKDVRRHQRRSSLGISGFTEFSLVVVIIIVIILFLVLLRLPLFPLLLPLLPPPPLPSSFPPSLLPSFLPTTPAFTFAFLKPLSKVLPRHYYSTPLWELARKADMEAALASK